MFPAGVMNDVVCVDCEDGGYCSVDFEYVSRVHVFCGCDVGNGDLLVGWLLYGEGKGVVCMVDGVYFAGECDCCVLIARKVSEDGGKWWVVLVLCKRVIGVKE